MADFQIIVALLDGGKIQGKNQSKNDAGKKKDTPDEVRLAAKNGDDSGRREQHAKGDQHFRRRQNKTACFSEAGETP